MCLKVKYIFIRLTIGRAVFPKMIGGAHFDMRDYHVFSLEDVMEGDVTDHGRVLDKTDVPWVKRQMWDCDCCEKGRKVLSLFPGQRPYGHLPSGSGCQ